MSVMLIVLLFLVGLMVGALIFGLLPMALESWEDYIDKRNRRLRREADQRQRDYIEETLNQMK